MSPVWGLLLPETAMFAAACVFLILGALLTRRGAEPALRRPADASTAGTAVAPDPALTTALWGAACLAVLAAAALLLPLESRRQPPLESRLQAASTAAPKPAPPPIARDALSTAGRWAILGVGVLFVLSAMETHRTAALAAQRFGLLLLCLAGAMLTAAADDLIVLFAGLELVALPMTGLLWLARDGRSGREAALKHFLPGLLFTALLLYGLALVYGLTGTTSLPAIRDVLAGSYLSPDPRQVVGSPSRLGTMALVFVFGGLGIRLGLVPFHFGLAEIAQGTTAWNAGLLAVLLRGAAFLAVVRATVGTLAGYEAAGQLLAGVLSGVTMLVAGALALTASNVRRMLAYATMSHAGFALAGVAVGFWDAAAPEHSLQAADGLPGGTASALFYLGGYALMASGLYALLTYLDRGDRPIEYVHDLAGLARAQPLAAACAAVLLLGLAGLPPLPGFWGRLFLTASTLSVQVVPRDGLEAVPHGGFVLLAVAGGVHLLMAATVSLRMLGAIFFGAPAGRPRPAGGQSALAAAVLASTLTLGVGLLPGPLVERLEPLDRRQAAAEPQPAPSARIIHHEKHEIQEKN